MIGAASNCEQGKGGSQGLLGHQLLENYLDRIIWSCAKFRHQASPRYPIEQHAAPLLYQLPDKDKGALNIFLISLLWWVPPQPSFPSSVSSLHVLWRRQVRMLMGRQIWKVPITAPDGMMPGNQAFGNLTCDLQAVNAIKQPPSLTISSPDWYPWVPIFPWAPISYWSLPYLYPCSTFPGPLAPRSPTVFLCHPNLPTFHLCFC